MSNSKAKKKIKAIYSLLFKVYGSQKWWPAKSLCEMITGAILTQNTSWNNVKKSIQSLKINKCLSFKSIDNANVAKIAKLIKPCGYYNIKAKRLKNFTDFLFTYYKGNIKLLFNTDTEKLRHELLLVNGIGPETADSILLYGGKRPVFVIDTYTKRLFSRHGIANEKQDYAFFQNIFHTFLPRSQKLFNEFHALIVEHCKQICRKKPLCEKCVLKTICYFDKSVRNKGKRIYADNK